LKVVRDLVVDVVIEDVAIEEGAGGIVLNMPEMSSMP
jgi:hypothetical protein